MEQKIRRMMNQISELLELLMSVIVLAAIVVALISLREPFLEFWRQGGQGEAFLTFLGKVMNIVIGIEFFKMLCKPEADTVLEVVMFVITRHMIIHDTTAVENLLTIVGIIAIVLVKRHLGPPQEGKGNIPWRWRSGRKAPEEGEESEARM